VIDGRCRATVEDRRNRADHLRYRGACLGCGWAGRSRDTSNAALEDALDHTLPEWRRVPIVERHHHDATNKQLERWAVQVAALYASHGLAECYFPASGGLIRTMRLPMGTRSHHSRGYFDVCAGVAAETGPAPATEQLELF
jgi:Fe-S cluster biogenesis protein NfuA